MMSTNRQGFRKVLSTSVTGLLLGTPLIWPQNTRADAVVTPAPLHVYRAQSAEGEPDPMAGEDASEGGGIIRGGLLKKLFNRNAQASGDTEIAAVEEETETERTYSRRELRRKAREYRRRRRFPELEAAKEEAAKTAAREEASSALSSSTRAPDPLDDIPFADDAPLPTNLMGNDPFAGLAPVGTSTSDDAGSDSLDIPFADDPPKTAELDLPTLSDTPAPAPAPAPLPDAPALLPETSTPVRTVPAETLPAESEDPFPSFADGAPPAPVTDPAPMPAAAPAEPKNDFFPDPFPDDSKTSSAPAPLPEPKADTLLTPSGESPDPFPVDNDSLPALPDPAPVQTPQETPVRDELAIPDPFPLDPAPQAETPAPRAMPVDDSDPFPVESNPAPAPEPNPFVFDRQSPPMTNDPAPVDDPFPAQAPSSDAPLDPFSFEPAVTRDLPAVEAATEPMPEQMPVSDPVPQEPAAEEDPFTGLTLEPSPYDTPMAETAEAPSIDRTVPDPFPLQPETASADKSDRDPVTGEPVDPEASLPTVDLMPGQLGDASGGQQPAVDPEMIPPEPDFFLPTPDREPEARQPRNAEEIPPAPELSSGEPGGAPRPLPVEGRARVSLAPSPIQAPATARHVGGTVQSKEEKLRSRRHLPGTKGFCLVTLRDSRDLQDGLAQYSAVYEGETYYLGGPEQQRKFMASPRTYVPAATGADVVHMGLTGERLLGSLDHAVWYKGRLYMFTSAETMETFVAAPSTYAVLN